MPGESIEGRNVLGSVQDTPGSELKRTGFLPGCASEGVAGEVLDTYADLAAARAEKARVEAQRNVTQDAFRAFRFLTS